MLKVQVRERIEEDGLEFDDSGFVALCPDNAGIVAGEGVDKTEALCNLLTQNMDHHALHDTIVIEGM